MFFKRKKCIDDIQANSTGTKIEQSDSGMKNNPNLLQESEEQEAEESNTDADVTSEADKIDENNKNMIISME